MFSISLALARIGRAVYRGFNDPLFRALLLVVSFLLITGPLFYMGAEGWSYIDSVYFCVMLMSTNGTGDLRPTGDLSKIFTLLYTVISVGAFVGLLARLTQTLLRGNVDAKDQSTDA